ncbi:hypothetical protein FOCC_FOCC017167, partial [Frankliniella occidentalis]
MVNNIADTAESANLRSCFAVLHPAGHQRVRQHHPGDEARDRVRPHQHGVPAVPAQRARREPGPVPHYEPAHEAGGADAAHRVLANGGQPAAVDHAPEGPGPAHRGRVLHKIDEVLQPVRIKAGVSADTLYNPNAAQLIQQSTNFDLDSYTIRSFADAVSRRKVDIFNKEGRFTFFIPVDSAFK